MEITWSTRQELQFLSNIGTYSDRTKRSADDVKTAIQCLEGYLTGLHRRKIVNTRGVNLDLGIIEAYAQTRLAKLRRIVYRRQFEVAE